MDKFVEGLRMLRFFLKCFPVLLLATQIAVPCYDWLRPWEPAIVQLSNAGVRARLCVGISSATTIDERGARTERSRTFLVFAPATVLPRMLTVWGESNKDATMQDGGAWGVLLWLCILGVCGLLVWKWWIQPLRANGREGLRLAI